MKLTPILLALTVTSLAKKHKSKTTNPPATACPTKCTTYYTTITRTPIPASNPTAWGLVTRGKVTTKVRYKPYKWRFRIFPPRQRRGEEEVGGPVATAVVTQPVGITWDGVGPGSVTVQRSVATAATQSPGMRYMCQRSLPVTGTAEALHAVEARS